ncbi:MAG: RNA polymerase sigma factor, partial [Myxococcota bacterium]
LIGVPEDAEDITQVVFTQAFLNIEKFDGRCQITTWLYAIMVRVLANQNRSKQRKRRLIVAYSHAQSTENSQAHDLEQSSAARQLLHRLVPAVDSLPEKIRVPFLLYHVEGLKLREIATIVDATVDTTFSRIRKARHRLAKSIVKYQHSEARS